MKHCMIFAHRVVALVCVFLQMFLVLGTTAFAVSNEDVGITENEYNDTASNEAEESAGYSLNNTTEETSTDLLYTIDTPFDLNPNIIRVSFDATDVVDCSSLVERLALLL